MDNLSTLTASRHDALTKWRQAIRAERQARDVETRKRMGELKRVYRALKDDKVLDLFLTLKDLPLNQDGEPAICLAPVGEKVGRFAKTEGGAGYFGNLSSRTNARNFGKAVSLPRDTWGPWPLKPGATENQSWNILRSNLRSPAPFVPPEYAEKASGPGPFFVLWEVPRWEAVPPADPLLLRRLTNNLFRIVAEWHLSPVEQAIIRGTL